MKTIALSILAFVVALLACYDPSGPDGYSSLRPTVRVAIEGNAQANSLYYITISGPGMSVIGPSWYTGGQTVELYVPEGMNRVFHFERYGSDSVLTDTGTTVANIGPGMNDISVALTAIIQMVPPAITMHPVDQSVTVGNTASFYVVASGTDMQYQWQMNGSDIAGATLALYTTAPTALAENESTYRCIIWNSKDTVTSNPATLIVVSSIVPASITTHPSKQSVTEGHSALFSVVATGTDLKYQWQKNGSDINGATQASYTITATSLTDDGAAFRCVVQNLADTVTSNAATLTVVQNVIAPAVTTHPSDQSVSEKQTASFSVVATGTDLKYQWLKNGSDINGATQASYTTPATSLTDSGAAFSCVIRNLADTVTSNAATLRVHPSGGLVAYYPFNGNATNATSGGFDGFVTGATLIKDRFGAQNCAYSFNGSSDFINIGNPMKTSTIMSISVWIKTSGPNGGNILAKKPTGDWASNPGWWGMGMTSTELSVIYQGSGWTAATIALIDSNWHHIVYVQTTNSSSIYIDGKNVATEVYTPVSQKENNILIGGREDVNPLYFTGNIDDVRLYAKSLNSNEIDSLYHEGGWPTNVISLQRMKRVSAAEMSYQMGSMAISDEQPVHTVSFTKDYWIDTTEVTQSQYSTLMSATYALYSNPTWSTHGTGANYPAYNVNWFDAALYCNALTVAGGSSDTVYRYVSITGTPGKRCALNGLTVDTSKDGYRLPTEAEWEYACRAGTTGDYYWATGSASTYAWYASNSGSVGHPAGQKLPNAWGLYDMSGNLWEWCNDWYGAYPSGTQANPIGPNSGSLRVMRGGSWGNDTLNVRSAVRSSGIPTDASYDIGFRVAKSIQ